MIKLQIGGSPCTHWSISKSIGRETTPSGIGWELYWNYLVAKQKFQPDFFLYENNWSAAQAIKDKISETLGYPLNRVNSSQVSAQCRDRFYVHNWHAEQPEDRKVRLIDILETTAPGEKQYEFNSLSAAEMKYMCRRVKDGRTHWDFAHHHSALNTKSSCLTANTYKGVPYNVLVEPLRIGTIKNSAKNVMHDSKQYRVYSPYAKATTLCGEGGGLGAKTGLYIVPSDEQKVPYYTVSSGQVWIDGEWYPINLPDGNYIIRKLTVTEASRLQTMPDNYCKAVSNTQAYRELGNGWTAEIIIHLLTAALKNIPRDEEIQVLSMYDGIATGRYCLDKMGFTNVTYKAYEIDKYAIKVALDNYPDIVECGDAFQVRDENWRY